MHKLIKVFYTNHDSLRLIFFITNADYNLPRISSAFANHITLIFSLIFVVWRPASSRHCSASKVIFQKVTSYRHLCNADASREHEVRVVAFSLIDDARSKLRSSEAWPSLSRRRKHTSAFSRGRFSCALYAE